MKKIYLILVIIVALIILIFLACRFLPAKYITGLLGNNNAASSLACSYPLRITGDSMEPDFKSGQLAVFNKCFTADDLAVSKTIAFKEGEVIRLGTINRIENLPKGLTYKVTQPKRQDRVIDVTYDQIIAVYKEEFADQAKIETSEQPDKPTEITMSAYALTLPAGWQTAKEDDEQSIFIKTSEPAQADFRTYLSVSRDKIGGGTLADYSNDLKAKISQSASRIRFDNENKVKINGLEAFAMDAYVKQNKVDFRILTVAIIGQASDVWVLNFNTLEANWDNNAPVFEEILNSFRIK